MYRWRTGNDSNRREMLTNQKLRFLHVINYLFILTDVIFIQICDEPIFSFDEIKESAAILFICDTCCLQNQGLNTCKLSHGEFTHTRWNYVCLNKIAFHVM